MNSLLLPLLFGVGVSPELVKNIMEEKKASLEKWRVALRLLATVIMGYIFFQRAVVPAVDSAGKPVYNDEGIQKSMNASFQENQFAAWIKETVLSMIDMGIELLKPSQSETLMISALMNAKPAASTTVIQQQPPLVPGGPAIGTIPNTFNNLRMTRFAGSPGYRAQGGVITPDGAIVFE